MADIIDFQKIQEEKTKRQEKVKINRQILDRIEHLIPKGGKKKDDTPPDSPPEAS